VVVGYIRQVADKERQWLGLMLIELIVRGYGCSGHSHLYVH